MKDINDFNLFLLENSYLLEDDVNPQMQQQMDPNAQMQQQQDPNAAQQQDPNQQQIDPNTGQPIDPNTGMPVDPMEQDPNAQVETPEVVNIEIVERLRIINDLKSIRNILDKIKILRNYDTKFNLDEMIDAIQSTINYMDVFTTEDLTSFKNSLSKKIKEDLYQIRSNINNLKEENVIDEEESLILENVEEFILYGTPRIKLTTTTNEAIKDILFKIRKKIRTMDEDEVCTAFGLKFTNHETKFILSDAVSIILKLKDLDQFYINDVFIFDGKKSYFKKDLVTFVKNIPFEISSGHEDRKCRLKLNEIPDDNSILEFAILLRYYTLDYYKPQKLKYQEYGTYALQFLVIEILAKSVKKDIDKEKLLELFKKVNIDDIVNKQYNEDELDDEELELLRYAEAALLYIEEVTKSKFIEQNKVFAKAYFDAMSKFISTYIPNSIHISYACGSRIIDSRKIMYHIHAFSATSLINNINEINYNLEELKK